MFEGIDFVALTVSALLMLAVGSIWYSPLLFGRHWMRATGLSEADLEASKSRIVGQIAGAFVANLVLLFVIAQFVLMAQAQELSIRFVASLLTLLLAGAIANVVIWEQKRVAYLLINIGYASVVIFGGLTVIWHWPW
jgi:hypothetical protein